MSVQYEYKPWKYFGWVFAATWAPWMVSISLSQAATESQYQSIFNFAGLFAPMLVTLAFIYGSGSAPLRKDFQQRLVDFRLLSWPHVLLTLGLVPAVTYASIWLSLPFGESRDQFQVVEGALMWLPIILLAPLLEEIAWRGYGVDSLRARYGMSKTALVFGVVWALWHLPMFFVKGTYHQELTTLGPLYVLNFFVSVVVVTFLANWLYYKHRRFIVAGIYFHFIINSVAILLGATAFTKVIVTALYIVVAVAIVLYDRRMFSEGPKTYVEGTR